MPPKCVDELSATQRLALGAGGQMMDEPDDEDWTAVWAQELDRRAAAVERGEEQLETWDSVEARIRAELQRK